MLFFEGPPWAAFLFFWLIQWSDVFAFAECVGGSGDVFQERTAKGVEMFTVLSRPRQRLLITPVVEDESELIQIM